MSSPFLKEYNEEIKAIQRSLEKALRKLEQLRRRTAFAHDIGRIDKYATFMAYMGHLKQIRVPLATANTRTRQQWLQKHVQKIQTEETYWLPKILETGGKQEEIQANLLGKLQERASNEKDIEGTAGPRSTFKRRQNQLS